MQELESLKSIFKDRIFRVPDYQRGYAWKEEHLEDFWEDIINLPNDRYHYTGLLSLKLVSKEVWKRWDEEGWLIEDRGFRPFHVVDGQQRLTTFIILINEIVNCVSQLPENQNKKHEEIYLGSFNLMEIQQEYLMIAKPPHAIIKSYKFGYEKDNPSSEFLKHRILSNTQNHGSVSESYYTLNLENAKAFFRENLNKYFNINGLAGIETLFKKLTRNLMFNIHEIQDDFDVFVAFETMNNRGKKLSNLELLKNRLIYLTTLYEESELNNDDKRILRDNINDAWKNIYFYLGRNKKRPLVDDEFLNAHWILSFPYTRQKGDDYIKYLLDEKFTPKNIFTKITVVKDSIIKVEEMGDDERDTDEFEEELPKQVTNAKLNPSEIEAYVESLKVAARHWYNTFNPINNPELDEQESLWLDRINRVGIVYFRPLLLATLMTSSIKKEKRIELFKQVERFIFVAFRLGRAFSNYRNSEFFRLARKLQNEEITVQEIIDILEARVEDWLEAKTAYDNQPFNTYIKRKFSNSSGFYGWNGLRYLLYEYEYEMMSKWGNPKIDWNLFVKNEDDKVSIEHIYPQTPSRTEWVEAFSNYSLEQQKYLTNSLGNLLPLSQSINSSLQNNIFSEKKHPLNRERRGYANGSHSEIEVSNYDEWTAETILERGLKLISFMEKRWDMKFPDNETKLEFLCLEFMKGSSTD